MTSLATPDAPPTRARRRSLALGSLAVLAVLAVVGAALSWTLFVRPSGVLRWPDEPAQADAIVMYGGSGNRFLAARDLADRGVAPTFVVSDPTDPDPQQIWTAYKAFCLYEEHPYERICFDPEPVTTRGESRYFANLATERGWDRLVAVTTVEQATRARLLLERCYDGEVELYVVPTARKRVFAILYEWGALARALVLRRGC